MTFFATNISATTGLSAFFSKLFDRMTTGMEGHAHHMSRRAQIEALEAKSDAELAEMGLKRDQIAYHVFHDLFYA
ncbi:hypothetical protein [Roseovarius sp. 2305UL8-3]|uniref:hypothetical protein n=1 Tax=Roseovarius conchicola TaxID=3121636 RepID=UPI003526F9A8